jgi:RNA polymerase sigma-70 factor (ECF subfamily)
MQALQVMEPSRNSSPQLSNETKLLEAARRGDVHAFNQLVQAYQGIAYRTAYRILGDEQVASDATQEAFISSYKHLASLRGESFKAWLLRIVTNACYDQLRAKKRQPAASLDALVESGEPEPKLARAVPDSPQELAERRELNDLIAKGLQMLPAEQRVTCILADIEEMSYEEISQITGANIGTVKSRLARARAQLRTFLLAQAEILPRTYRMPVVQKTALPLQ